MNFDRSDWLGEIVSGTLTGTGAGLVGALLFPAIGVGSLLGAATGAVTGLASGILAYPIKWLWGNLREKGELASTKLASIKEADEDLARENIPRPIIAPNPEKRQPEAPLSSFSTREGSRES